MVQNNSETNNSNSIIIDTHKVIVDRGSVIVDFSGFIVDFTASIVDRGTVIVDRGSVIVDFNGSIVDRGSVIVDFATLCHRQKISHHSSPTLAILAPSPVKAPWNHNNKLCVAPDAVTHEMIHSFVTAMHIMQKRSKESQKKSIQFIVRNSSIFQIIKHIKNHQIDANIQNSETTHYIVHNNL